MNFFTRPTIEDRSMVQYSSMTITLSGQTNISNLGQFVIQGPILDFTGTTSASTLYTIAGVSGYINYGNASSFKIQPPLIIQSGGTGTTTVDVTGYILSSLDADGNIVWSQPVDINISGFTYNDANKLTILNNNGSEYSVYLNQFSGLTVNGSVTATTYYGDGSNLTGLASNDFYVTGGTYVGTTLTLERQNGSVVITGFTSVFTGNTSASCITDLFVSNVNSCSPLRIQNISSGNVLIGENGGVNVGIGTSVPLSKLHLNGDALIQGDVNILGNVNILGTATTINTETVQTRDNKILLNYSGTTLSAIGGGIEILSAKTDGNNVSLTTDIYGDWNSNTGLNVVGRTDNSTSYSLKIQNSGGTNNFVVRGDGNVGIGVNSPTQKLFVSGNTRSENNIDGDVSIISVNTNNGGTLARGVLASSAIADISGRILSGQFATSGYNTDLSGSNFGDGGTGYLKNALTISVAGNPPRGDINIGTRDSSKFLRFFAGSKDFDSSSLKGSLEGTNGYWGFGQNMTGQTAIVHIKGSGSGSTTNSLKIDNSSNSPLFYVRDDGNVGIGVENPTEKLHVSGNTKITGGLNIGTIGFGSPIINLGLDSNGNVVTGTTTSGGGGGTFTGNTSASCITDLYVTNLHGCSPIIVHDILSGNSTNNYLDLVSYNDTLKIASNFSTNNVLLGLGNNYSGIYLGFQSGGNLTMAPGSTSLYNTQVGINTNNGGTINSHSSYGIEISTPKSIGTGSLFLVKTNDSSGTNLVNNDFYSGALQSEIVIGRPNSLLTPLSPGVMGTGVGNNQTGGTEYDPIFLTTPRSYSYDTVNYDTIKNVLFGGGSDNSVYTGVTNSALIAGSGNTINSYIKNSVILGGIKNLISLNFTPSSIIGSSDSTISYGNYSSIIGGYNNVITGDTSEPGLGTSHSSVVLVGNNNKIFDSKNSTILGGDNNLISNKLGIFGGTGSSIIGGNNNIIRDRSDYSVIIGGFDNTIKTNSDQSLIIGGSNNIINNSASSNIIGGYNHLINLADYSIILGGQNITATTSNTVYVPSLNINNVGSNTPVINLGLDSNGNVVTGTTVGSDITSLGTGLTIHFSGKTVFNLPTSPASGNISGDTTNAKFGMIQKIYHQSAVEPTFPATWNLVGEGVYFTNELNIIYAEYVTNTWIEYWIIQIQ